MPQLIDPKAISDCLGQPLANGDAVMLTRHGKSQHPHATAYPLEPGDVGQYERANSINNAIGYVVFDRYPRMSLVIENNTLQKL